MSSTKGFAQLCVLRALQFCWKIWSSLKFRWMLLQAPGACAAAVPRRKGGGAREAAGALASRGRPTWWVVPCARSTRLCVKAPPPPRDPIHLPAREFAGADQCCCCSRPAAEGIKYVSNFSRGSVIVQPM